MINHDDADESATRDAAQCFQARSRVATRIRKSLISSISSSLPSAYFSEIQENTIPPTEAELREMFEKSRNQSRYLGSFNTSSPGGNFEE